MSDFFSLCTITCGINHRKPDGKDLTKEDVIQEMTYAIENLTAAGIKPDSFAFQIRVEYKLKETT